MYHHRVQLLAGTGVHKQYWYEPGTVHKDLTWAYRDVVYDGTLRCIQRCASSGSTTNYHDTK